MTGDIFGKSGRWIRKGISKGIQGKSIIYIESLYRQEWDNSIRTKERFTVYSTFKSSLSLAHYLDELKHIKARNVLIRLKLGGSPLKTHKLRSCKDATPVDYFCPFCKSGVEKSTSNSSVRNMKKLENSTYPRNISLAVTASS